MTTPSNHLVPGNLSLQGSKNDAFLSDANSAICIRFVHATGPAEMEFRYSKTFHPLLTYQIFGESEKIAGYKNLQVKVRFFFLYNFLYAPLMGRIQPFKTFSWRLLNSPTLRKKCRLFLGAPFYYK